MNESQAYLNLSTELKRFVTAEQAWHYQIIPKASNGEQLTLYISDKQPLSIVQNELEIILAKQVDFDVVANHLIQNTLLRSYPKAVVQKALTTEGKEKDLLLQLFMEAKNLGSSDIHIEIYKENCRVRVRKDGMLIERHKLNVKEYPSLINRIKIQSNLDISEKRLPQDGRIYIQEKGSSFDVRVSTMPTFFGEKVVLRLLRTDSTHVDLNASGFTAQQYEHYWQAVQKQNGIVLISGPTGSGKTTTLYSTLKLLNDAKKNILTVEDPIEYMLDGVNQVQVKEAIGFTFAKAMRSFLRQDPDIIMLGEIRDGETAQMAIRASLTGHLVLSTIHTNSAWGTISRLIDMGVPSFLISSTLNVSVAQRLLRTLCPNCKRKSTDQKQIHRLKKLNIEVEELSEPVGCEQCFFTGYSGRKAVFEVLPVTTELVQFIQSNQHSIEQYQKERQMETIQSRVEQLLKEQLTSFEEAYPILLSS